MANSEEEQKDFFQQALTAVKSPIGLVIVVFYLLGQFFNTVITLVSSGKEYANSIIVLFLAALGFMIIVFGIAVIYDLFIRQQVLKNDLEKENYRLVIQQKNEDIRRLEKQLEERRN